MYSLLSKNPHVGINKPFTFVYSTTSTKHLTRKLFFFMKSLRTAYIILRSASLCDKCDLYLKALVEKRGQS